MAKLIIKSGSGSLEEFPLRPGINSIGRNPGNDFQIADPSVSGTHCEIILKENSVVVRDLNSTNGTFIERQPIQESPLQPGQTLHLGSVEIVYSAPATAGPVARVGLKVATPVKSPVEADASGATPASHSGLRVAPVAAPRTAETPPPLPNYGGPTRYIPSPPPQDHRTFFQRLPSVFAYPFKRNGLILLVTGGLLFLFLDFLGGFSLIIAGIGFGYLAAYMQKVIVFSAQGESEMPSWPEFGGWWDDIIHPALLLVASFAASFGPAIVVWIFTDWDPSTKLMVGSALGLFGCFYLPMALLATSMAQSFFALNPILIVPSIMRIPGAYLVACVLLVILGGLRVGCDLVLNLIPVPVLPTILMGFVSLYFICVQMRVLGVLYHAKKEELNWGF